MEIENIKHYIKMNNILKNSIHSLKTQGMSTYDLTIQIRENDKKIEKIIKLYKKYEQFYKRRGELY